VGGEVVGGQEEVLQAIKVTLHTQHSSWYTHCAHVLCEVMLFGASIAECEYWSPSSDVLHLQ
jgi:hypothetical protein